MEFSSREDLNVFGIYGLTLKNRFCRKRLTGFEENDFLLKFFVHRIKCRALNIFNDFSNVKYCTNNVKQQTLLILNIRTCRQHKKVFVFKISTFKHASQFIICICIFHTVVIFLYFNLLRFFLVSQVFFLTEEC